LSKKNFLLIIFIVLIIIAYGTVNKRDYIKHKLLTNLPPHVQTAVQLINAPERVKHFKNDYNVNFLPNTQFINLNYNEINLGFEPSEDLINNYSEEEEKISFKIDVYEDFIYAFDSKANVKKFKLILNEGEIKPTEYKNIPTNLKNIFSVLDVLIHDKMLYISYLIKTPECQYLKISRSKISIIPLDFKIIYQPEFCFNNLQAARLQFYNHNNKDGLLISTSVVHAKEQRLAQDPQSIQGKILFLDLNNNMPNIFSYGHRSPQGLLVINDTILSTEHGPNGGDEINKIEYKGNYGWPISSYGEPYYEDSLKPVFRKDHKNNGFIEPIFSFIPSIGISEIINLPNSFSQHWQNNFILSSLNNNSLFRIKFDDKYSKVIYFERIFIGKRIRDIKYYNKLNIILLAQEYDSTLGILSN
jgi:hypothetical protein